VGSDLGKAIGGMVELLFAAVSVAVCGLVGALVALACSFMVGVSAWLFVGPVVGGLVGLALARLALR
jgi:hypothetical protein